MSRILVTGAAGFTGRYLGCRLSQNGHEVHGLTIGSADSPIEGYARLHVCNLTDVAGLRRIVEDEPFDKIVHLAAIANVAHDDIAQMYTVNVIGTRNLLEALSQAKKRPTAVLLASSANIYGNIREGILDERTSPSPANDYGVTKLSMEWVASIFATRLPLIIARPFNYTGRGQSAEFVIPKIVDHVRRRAQRIELGALNVARDFSDVRTVVDAYARLLESERAVGQTINVCSGKALRLQSVLDMIGEIAGFLPEVKVNRAFIRPNEVRSLVGSKAKIENVIGPLETISLEQTLRWMLG